MLLVSATTVVVGVGLMLATSWVLGLVYLAGAVPMIWLGLPVPRGLQGGRPAAPATRRGTSRRPSRSRCTASACSRRSVAGDDALDDFVRQADALRTDRGAQGADAVAGVVRARAPSRRRSSRCRSAIGVSLTSRGRAQRRRAGRVLRHRGRGQQPRGAARHAARDDARRQGRDRPVPAGHGHGVGRARPGGAGRRCPSRDPAGSRVELSGVHFAHPRSAAADGTREAARTSSRGSTWCWSRGRRWRSSGSPAAARRPCSSWCHASTTSPRAASGSTAWTCAT